jgi:hypothetical protein
VAQSWNNRKLSVSGDNTPWVFLQMEEFGLPAMLDPMCDVFNNIQKLALRHMVETVGERCLMANAAPHLVTEAVTLFIKIQLFSWKIRFLVLDHCPVPCILGADFLTTAKMRLDFATRRYSFGFKPEQEFEFACLDVTKQASQEFPCPREEFGPLMCGSVNDVAEDSFLLNILV